jgi:HAD superfamily hydrolase (TIGR01509 family)
MVVKAVLADYDGSIRDVERAKERIIEGWCEFFGLDPRQLFATRGTSEELDLRELANLMHWELDELYGELVIRATLEASELSGFSTLVQVIRDLGLRWGIGSNGYRARIELGLRAQNIDIPEIVCINDLPQGNRKGKPEPDIYTMLMLALNVTPEEVIVLEDSPSGARGAVNARIPAHQVYVIGVFTQEEMARFPQGVVFVPTWNEVSVVLLSDFQT